ncbi:MAG: sensor histidine kinase [bacterium]
MKISPWRLGGLTLGALAIYYWFRNSTWKSDGTESGSETTYLSDSPGEVSGWFNGEILSPVHHELRTHMDLLTNYSEMLPDGTEDKDKINVTSKKLTNLIDTFISGLRLESTDYQPQPESLSIQSIVEERIERLKSLYNFFGRTIKTDFEEAPTEVTWDRRFLILLIDTLLVECAEPADGTSFVALKRPDASSNESAILEVQDFKRSWGARRQEHLRQGLSQETPEELVNKFSPETGLRLYTAQQLLERQGGEFRAVTEARPGAVFRCYL